MKTLYIIRHAKSSWKYTELQDIERPLKKRGKEDAELMAEQLRKLNEHPQHFISSQAVRALDTAKIFSKILEVDVASIEINTSIYNSSTRELHTIVLNTKNDITALALVGHEPTLPQFTTFLTKQVYEKIPTSGIVAIEFAVEHWTEIKEHTGKIKFFIYPKMFV
jgi:phosphohistidine phosphatase